MRKERAVKKISALIIIGVCLLLAVALAGCQPPPSLPTEPLETLSPIPIESREGYVVISEFMPGMPGDNNYEFVELYNTGTTPIDLKGWALWYRLDDSQEPLRVYLWPRSATVPGYGHLLLVREGADVGAVPDARFETPLLDSKGGLALQDAEGNVVDALGWGAAPAGFVEGTPAPPAEGVASLERRPGGSEGNAADSGDNAIDFALVEPHPQNSGSAMTPLPERRLVLAVDAPESVSPGAEFTTNLVLANRTGVPLHDVQVILPALEDLDLLSAEVDEGTLSEGPSALWEIPELAEGAEYAASLTLQAPWRYVDVALKGFYVEAPEWPLRSYGPLESIAVTGGAVPIGVARTLTREVVIVEGFATMYTGGYYAGSTGTKFYLEDETGGIQVYCPGGSGLINVGLGDRVRVTGEIQLYRDSIEIIPRIYPDDVEVLEPKAIEPQALPVTVREAATDDLLLGRLLTVEGVATRIEEFNYSYEVDLVDEEGNSLLAYVEKDTGVSVEPLEVGKRYRVTGIGELYSARRQLKPRVQGDFARIYPPELMIDVVAQNSVEPGDLVTYTITVHNHTPVTLTQVEIMTAQPNTGATIERVLDGGEQSGAAVVWAFPELAPGGGSVTVRYAVRVDAEATGRILMPGAVVTADRWSGPVESKAWTTFLGSGVPIWAIQGAGMQSPYVLGEATTEGVVTGVFPELEGFWMQNLEPDDDSATSEGIFVFTKGFEPNVVVGDRVLVKGQVREKSGQTILQPGAPAHVELLESGTLLPEAVDLDPPRDEAESSAYYEALEGMLVRVREPALAVAPVSKYGEYAVVRPAWKIERVMRGEPRGMLIFVDDGSNVRYDDASTLPYAVSTGDRVSSLLGPLAYTYENYKIEPIVTPTVASSGRPLPHLAPPGANAVSVATFNVENLFDFTLPNPSDPPMPSLREYRTRLEKLAQTIVAMGAPTIVGFQEVESVRVLEDVAEQELLAGYNYRPFLIEGTDERGIDVGYLVRDAAAVEVGAYPAPEGLTSRPPLMITVTLELESGLQRLYLLNNHFTSMAGGEEATEPRRIAQAAWNVVLVEEILAREPEAQIVVMGDLNSFYDSAPLDTLREGGLHHVYEVLTEGERPYTYIFQGESETLDHLLVSPALFERLVRVEALHVNADHPLPAPNDLSPRRLSDHDPLVAVFSFD